MKKQKSLLLMAPIRPPRAWSSHAQETAGASSRYGHPFVFIKSHYCPPKERCVGGLSAQSPPTRPPVLPSGLVTLIAAAGPYMPAGVCHMVCAPLAGSFWHLFSGSFRPTV